MDIIKELYNQVSAQLKAQVPTIRFIDFNNGQLEADEPQVSFPCALIDITDIAYMDGGDDDDYALCEVTITFGFLTMEHTNNLTPNPQGLAHSSILTSAMMAIKGFEFDNSEKFIRKRLTRLPAQGIKAYSAVFNVSVFGDC